MNENNNPEAPDFGFGSPKGFLEDLENWGISAENAFAGTGDAEKDFPETEISESEASDDL